MNAKRIIVSLFFTVMLFSQVCFANSSSKLDNKLFSLTVPDDVAELSFIEVSDTSISFRDALSYGKNEGYGGFVAGFYAFENEEDVPDKLDDFERYGILFDETGKEYYIVIGYPTDIQFDYNDPHAIDQYHYISEAIPDIGKTLTPAKGCTYYTQDEYKTADYDIEKLKSQQPVKTYTVSGVDLYLALRTEPAYAYENEIGKIYNGETVQVQNTDTNNADYWYVYAPTLGKSGFVNCNYLK